MSYTLLKLQEGIYQNLEGFTRISQRNILNFCYKDSSKCCHSSSNLLVYVAYPYYISSEQTSVEPVDWISGGLNPIFFANVFAKPLTGDVYMITSFYDTRFTKNAEGKKAL